MRGARWRDRMAFFLAVERNAPLRIVPAVICSSPAGKWRSNPGFCSKLVDRRVRWYARRPSEKITYYDAAWRDLNALTTRALVLIEHDARPGLHCGPWAMGSTDNNGGQYGVPTRAASAAASEETERGTQGLE